VLTVRALAWTTLTRSAAVDHDEPRAQVAESKLTRD
jgi:hypothetical protein